jgi:hypothetical protein
LERVVPWSVLFLGKKFSLRSILMKKEWMAFLSIGVLGFASYLSTVSQGTDFVVEVEEVCAPEAVVLDENGDLLPLPIEPLNWPGGAQPVFVDMEGLVGEHTIVNGSSSSDIYINLSDDDQHTMTLLSGFSSGGPTSQTEMTWEPSSGNFASIAIVEPGAVVPFGFESLGFANQCNCDDDNEDGYTARIVFKPAPDLFAGEEYIVVTTVNADGVTLQTFPRADYAMVATVGWPWWLGGSTPPPAPVPPPVGPAVPLPPVAGPAVLPPLPPGAALPPGMGATVGAQYVRIGLALGKMGSKKAKCDWLMRQAGLWCKFPGNKPTAEALALWIAHLSC